MTFVTCYIIKFVPWIMQPLKSAFKSTGIYSFNPKAISTEPEVYELSCNNILVEPDPATEPKLPRTKHDLHDDSHNLASPSEITEIMVHLRNFW